MKSKIIKISYSSRFQKHKTISVPKIHIEGKWLEEIGFPIGALAKIEYENGSIHIRLLTPEEEALNQRQSLQAQLSQKQSELDLLKNQLFSLSQVADTPVNYGKSSTNS